MGKAAHIFNAHREPLFVDAGVLGTLHDQTYCEGQKKERAGMAAIHGLEVVWAGYSDWINILLHAIVIDLLKMFYEVEIMHSFPASNMICPT